MIDDGCKYIGQIVDHEFSRPDTVVVIGHVLDVVFDTPGSSFFFSSG